jgi:hypothetical protein
MAASAVPQYRYPFGTPFTVEFDEDPSTGYQWTYLRQISSDGGLSWHFFFYHPVSGMLDIASFVNSTLVSTTQTRVITFNPSKVGNSFFQFIQVKPGDPTPGTNATVHIFVLANE